MKTHNSALKAEIQRSSKKALELLSNKEKVDSDFYLFDKIYHPIKYLDALIKQLELIQEEDNDIKFQELLDKINIPKVFLISINDYEFWNNFQDLINSYLRK